jgi:hypothetical protein
VNEEEFRHILKHRKDDEFVEDDDGLGYADIGEDDWDQTAYSSEDERRREGRSFYSRILQNSNLILKPH